MASVRLPSGTRIQNLYGDPNSSGGCDAAIDAQVLVKALVVIEKRRDKAGGTVKLSDRRLRRLLARRVPPDKSVVEGCAKRRGT
jgi:hypothetical protein